MENMQEQRSRLKAAECIASVFISSLYSQISSCNCKKNKEECRKKNVILEFSISLHTVLV